MKKAGERDATIYARVKSVNKLYVARQTKKLGLRSEAAFIDFMLDEARSASKKKSSK